MNSKNFYQIARPVRIEKIQTLSKSTNQDLGRESANEESFEKILKKTMEKNLEKNRKSVA